MWFQNAYRRLGRGRVLFFGRFQPFHLGHLEAVKWLYERYQEVVILVGMADESHTWLNPFTAGERLLMIRAALEWAGLNLARIVTATIQTLSVYAGNAGFVLGYVPPVEAVATANPAVSRAFRDAGVKTVTPPLRNKSVWSGEYIRCLMLLGSDEWRLHVPEPVAEIIDYIDGVSRVREIAENYPDIASACKKLAQQR
ncbi:nicotinamide-nucleotide adenylyltransferase [Hyperthermus butylicus]|uniref:nicotinamide-nucleotide adenylyltransferase n=1 Tax=Hyperthermus butylicus TaxID=54248 RepID=UPI000B1E33D6|nr:nicotinamide-nucleotide adenylyltransferase [Hyperthermus butylicus]